MQRMIENVIIAEEADNIGLEVSDEEVEEMIESLFGYYPQRRTHRHHHPYHCADLHPFCGTTGPGHHSSHRNARTHCHRPGGYSHHL